MNALVRLYPPAWRARYGREFEALLNERPPTARDVLDIVVGAVDARLSPQVAAAPGLSTALSARLAGAAAIVGGLLLSVSTALAGLNRNDADYGPPIIAALALILLSLPGTYMRRYARPIALGLGAGAVGLAMLLLQIVPWGPLLLVPTALLLGAIGPGAFALAAARAGIATRHRWRVIALVMPWPVIGTFIATSGMAPDSIAGPVLVACVLPLGLAWMATGARIVSSRPADTNTIAGGFA